VTCLSRRVREKNTGREKAEGGMSTRGGRKESLAMLGSRNFVLRRYTLGTVRAAQ